MSRIVTKGGSQEHLDSIALVIRGIVLAAGASARMGSPKALLPDGGGRLFITRVLHTFSSAGLTDLTVVTGSLHDAIVREVATDPPRGAMVRFARNPDPARGQLSSLITGLDAADQPGVDAVLVTLVDLPFVTAQTVRAVLHASPAAPIVRPALRGRHGHPVRFARSLFNELRRADPSQGAKAVVRAHAAETMNVASDDEGAVLDVDTRDDYERIVRGSPSSPIDI